MTPLDWLLLYLSPAGLLVAFLFYAAGKRTGLKLLEGIGELGLLSDMLWGAVLHLCGWGPYPEPASPKLADLLKSRTVTALAKARTRDGKPSACVLCRALNWLDPGHC